MKRFLSFAVLAFACALCLSGANAQSYGPIDTRPGGVNSGIGGGLGGADLPDSRARPPTYGNRAPSGYEATRSQCFKDGKLVDRAYCESDQFYRPDRTPGMGIYSERCSNANTRYNPVTNSYIGLDGLTYYCH